MADADRVDDLLSVYFARPEAGVPPTAEELCRDCPELLPELRRRIAAAQAVNRLVEVSDPGAPTPAFPNPFGSTVTRAPDVSRTLAVEVISGPHAGERFELSGHDAYTIGRQPALSVSLPSDKHLSRVHLLLDTRGPVARAIDLGSTGGTFVGGVRVATADIESDIELRLGPATTLRVRVLAGVDLHASTVATPPLSRSHSPPRIPGYMLGPELGRGNMGVVYQATVEATGEVVALKTILPAVTPTRVAVGRFCREAECLAQLRHPNVVGYRDSGAAGGMLYVAMEFVPGRNASEIVAREGPLDPQRVLHWSGQLLDALAHAHAAGFVHRDVKPGNLLVASGTAGEVVKLSDFGLARAFDASGLSGLTADNAGGGTPAFMPPEQVTDFRTVRPAADQYAAAATLYYLLSGSPVYPPGSSVSAMLGRILTEEPVPLRPGAPPLPDPFGPVIRRALARDPAARFPDVAAMRAALLDP